MKNKANRTGHVFENQIENLITERNYMWFPPNRIIAGSILEQPIYTAQYPISKSLYEGKDTRADFILYHPQKHPDFLIIECKWQQSKGTAEEKLPYLVSNIEQNYKYPSMIVIDGGGHSKGAIKWIKDQEGESISHVCSLSEFTRMVNNDFI